MSDLTACKMDSRLCHKLVKMLLIHIKDSAASGAHKVTVGIDPGVKSV